MLYIQKEDSKWCSGNWDMVNDLTQGLDSIEDLDDAFPTPPALCIPSSHQIPLK